jgi:hypothetical protein
VPKTPINLGKLVAVHATAPAYIQRAAIVALLSFLFFVGMLVAFAARRHFMYLLLAAAFFVVNIFTLIGFLMQRRNVVRVYERGLSYGRTRIEWNSITTFQIADSGELEIETADGPKSSIPKSIDRVDLLAQSIRRNTTT